MNNRYRSIEEFYTTRGGRASGEVDYGVGWTEEGRRYPTFRVSWVQDTGDLYARNLSSGAIELLANAPACGHRRFHKTRTRGECEAYDAIEQLLEGWAVQCGRPGSLAWVRERAATLPSARERDIAYHDRLARTGGRWQIP